MSDARTEYADIIDMPHSSAKLGHTVNKSFTPRYNFFITLFPQYIKQYDRLESRQSY